MVRPLGGCLYRPAKVANPKGIDLPCSVIHDNTYLGLSKTKYFVRFVAVALESFRYAQIWSDYTPQLTRIHHDTEWSTISV